MLYSSRKLKQRDKFIVIQSTWCYGRGVDGLRDNILPEAEPRIITKRKRELGEMKVIRKGHNGVWQRELNMHKSQSDGVHGEF